MQSVMAGKRCTIFFALCLQAAACVPYKTAMLDSTDPLGLIVSMLLLSRRVLAVAVGGNCTVWTITADGAVETSTLPGCSGNALLNSVVNVSDSFLIVGETSAAAGCGIWKSQNGTDWTKITCPISEPLGSVAFHPSTKVLVAGGYCVLPGGTTYNMIRSADLGITWTTQGAITIGGPCTATDKVHTLTWYSGGFAALNSFAGNMGRSVDNGVTWGSSPFNPNVTALTRAYPGTGTRIIITGTSGGVPSSSYTDDAGTTTFSASTPFGFLSSNSGAVIADTGTSLLSSGDNCSIGSSTNNAVSWTAAASWSECSSTPANWRALTVTFTGKAYVGGNTISGQTERFGISSSGIPGSWTLKSLKSSNTVMSIAARD